MPSLLSLDADLIGVDLKTRSLGSECHRLVFGDEHSSSPDSSSRRRLLLIWTFVSLRLPRPDEVSGSKSTVILGKGDCCSSFESGLFFKKLTGDNLELLL